SRTSTRRAPSSSKRVAQPMASSASAYVPVFFSTTRITFCCHLLRRRSWYLPGLPAEGAERCRRKGATNNGPHHQARHRYSLGIRRVRGTKCHYEVVGYTSKSAAQSPV